jgi:Xaa-Pro aminopeptidase
MERTKSAHKIRLEKLRARFDEYKIDAFLITFLPHLRYITGFSGSNGLALVTRNSAYLVTDGRYGAQVRAETTGWKIFITTTDIVEELGKNKLLRPRRRVGFDGNSILYSQLKNLKRIMPSVKFLPLVDTIEKLACVKDESEIASIRRAVEVTDHVFTELLGILKPGISEVDIAAEISYRHRKHESEGDGFEPIIASGERGSLPHGKPSQKKLKSGEMITLDFGCLVNGYHSDMTRTVAVGRPKAEMKKIYQVVYDAQRIGIDAIKSGKKAAEIDHAARAYINEKGYEKYFRHSLGHGIGLQIHEQPRLSLISKATLQPGNVITVEPGIYVPGIGGVRIEDDVVVRDGHCDILTASPKELIIL